MFREMSTYIKEYLYVRSSPKGFFFSLIKQADRMLRWTCTHKDLLHKIFLQHYYFH